MARYGALVKGTDEGVKNHGVAVDGSGAARDAASAVGARITDLVGILEASAIVAKAG
jgi:hypothetical protein